MTLAGLKVSTWISIVGLCLSLAAFGVSILTYFTNADRYTASNTLAMLDKRLHPEVLASMREVAVCVRAADACDPMQDVEMQQAFIVFFGYLESVALCVELDLCSREVAANALAGEIDAAKHLDGWVNTARMHYGDADYLLSTEKVFLEK